MKGRGMFASPKSWWRDVRRTLHMTVKLFSSFGDTIDLFTSTNRADKVDGHFISVCYLSRASFNTSSHGLRCYGL